MWSCVSCSTCTVGLVLPLWSNTLIHLDGDGWGITFTHKPSSAFLNTTFTKCSDWTCCIPLIRGFSVSTVNRVHVFKPVSVQAMWWVSIKTAFFHFHTFLNSVNGFSLAHILTGQPCNPCIRFARWPDVITTTPGVYSWPGSVTIRAVWPPTNTASMSGMPCKTCSLTAQTRPCCSPTCE